ncbi:MAG: DUF6110 family protein [Mobilitalea sp.]
MYKYNYFKDRDWKRTGLFVAGVIFGTAGIKILFSRDAKKVYTYVTAAVLRAKECIMDTASTVQENAEDIMAEAKNMNEKRTGKDQPYNEAGEFEI